ncbi:hypothetical protein Pan97_10080 [Bremerella volcania]|uniref:Uncharacterized protein n=1 Tax=Bremerella volcania TaxID=2527984 RepID=A0A518C456_9BACT|nr:hypothetical protein [Bremerella volcania]QDU74008.1 hypothetical protein Pan97_10080 [Bremerella volcania]
MTKPLGTPQNREPQDTQGTFYGHPIVIRVKDLTWQPPVEPAPAPQQDWVSNLLGEDTHEGDHHESLLVAAPVASQPAPQPQAAPLPQPKVEATPQPQAEPVAPTKPSYIHNSNETRQHRRASILSSQMKNRLALSGIAVSLLAVSFYALSGSGGSDQSPVENVPQDLFVSTGELGDAPAWNANPAASDPSETITVEPFEGEIPQIASLPTRNPSSNPTMSNPSRDVQMTNIATPDVMQTGNMSHSYGNPAQGSEPAGSPADQVWQFGPSNMNPDYEEPLGGPAFTDQVPEYRNDVPQFDGSQPTMGQPQPSQTRPLPGGSMNMSDPRTSQYQAPAGDSGRHWMQQEQSEWDYQDGKLVRNSSRGNPASPGTQMPEIHEGYQHQAGYPVVNNQMPENAPAPGMQQDNSQWGFGPYSGSSMPQEAAQPRARLGGIQPLDLESR